MTLDEAIKRYEETAAEKEAKAKFYKEFARGSDMIVISKWQECAKEHRQLAEWLRELKMYKGVPFGPEGEEEGEG